jgi:NADH-quinone oxidoreductase subunit L
LLVAFLGKAPESEPAEHAHESPSVMTVPLLVLAVPSVLAGLWGVEPFYGALVWACWNGHGGWMQQLFAPFSHSPVAALASLGAVALGAFLAWPLYSRVQRDPAARQTGGVFAGRCGTGSISMSCTSGSLLPPRKPSPPGRTD